MFCVWVYADVPLGERHFFSNFSKCAAEASMTLLFLEKSFVENHCCLPRDRLTSELHSPAGQRPGLLVPAAVPGPMEKPLYGEVKRLQRSASARNPCRTPRNRKTRDRTHSPKLGHTPGLTVDQAGCCTGRYCSRNLSRKWG